MYYIYDSKEKEEGERREIDVVGTLGAEIQAFLKRIRPSYRHCAGRPLRCNSLPDDSHFMVTMTLSMRSERGLGLCASGAYGLGFVW
jgi:hypothetical protein